MKDYLKFLMYWWSKIEYSIKAALVILAVVALFVLCNVVFPAIAGVVFLGLVTGSLAAWLIGITCVAVYHSYKKNRTAFLKEQEYNAQRVVDRLAGR
jgi:hypothetical protein